MAVRRFVVFLLKHTQSITITLTALAILRLRNAHSVYVGGGASAAGFVAKGLKRCFRQPRPVGTAKQTYGMPSTHSASMSFIGVYLALLALTTPLPSHAHALPSGPSLLVALASLAVAASVCWSRVYLGHHTPLQVTAGALLGGLCAIVAFLVYPTDLALTMERAVGDALLLSLDAWRDRNPRHLAGLKEIYRTVL